MAKAKKTNKMGKLGMVMAAGAVVAGAVAAGVALSKKKNKEKLGKVMDQLKKKGKAVNEKVVKAGQKVKKAAKVIRSK